MSANFKLIGSSITRQTGIIARYALGLALSVLMKCVHVCMNECACMCACVCRNSWRRVHDAEIHGQWSRAQAKLVIANTFTCRMWADFEYALA